jgi:uncharacterized protein YgfB (UPF0149 family)
MSGEYSSLSLPEYQLVTESIYCLMLDKSASQLHGIICGYLCAGAVGPCEAYLRSLVTKRDEESRNALLTLFSVYSISQEQIANYDFSFRMLLPDDNEPLIERAQAFGEWCAGFIEGLSMAGVDWDEFQEEDDRDVLHHISEFSEIDYLALDVDEDDEKSLMEVHEYTRAAIIRLHGELMMNKKELDGTDTTH